MAAVVSSKSMVSRHKYLSRSIKLYLYDLDKWCKKKNRWDEWRYKKTGWIMEGPTASTNIEKIKLALAKNSRLTTKKEDKSAPTQNSRWRTSDEKGIQCFVSHSLYPEYRHRRPGEPLFLRLSKMDCGPHAYEDAHRTLSYNQFLRTYLSFEKGAHRIPRSLFTEMIVNGAIPDVITFSILIRYYCKYFNYQCILDVFYTQMKALGVEADDTFYKKLIYGVCARFGPNVGYQLLKELRSDRGIQLPLSCYDMVVRQFCKKNSLMTSTNALELIDALMDMEQQGHFPDYRIYDCLIKGERYHWGESFIKAGGIGRQMFTQGLKIGAVSNIVVKKRSRKLVINRVKSSLSHDFFMKT